MNGTLERASFRNVPFYVETTSVPVGQKVQVHEYPKRDQPYVEPMGKQAGKHKFTAFVIGKDCLEQRDALLKALEQGEGKLVHPWLGTLDVVVGECEMTHVRKDGGMVKFELVFHASAPRIFPSAKVDGGQQNEEAARELFLSSLGRYKAASAKINTARINAQGLSGQLLDVYTVMGQQFAPVLGDYFSIGVFTQSLINTPLSLMTRFESYFSELGLGTSLLAAPALSSSMAFVSYGTTLASLSRHAEYAKSISGLSVSSGADTTALAQAAANLVQDALLIQAALVAAQMPVARAATVVSAPGAVDQQQLAVVARDQLPVANDVTAVRDAFDQAIWMAALKAEPEHYVALNNVRLRMQRHLTSVAVSGVRLRIFTPNEVLPALVLAHRRFGDTTRVGEIVQRNKIQHPGFVAPRPLQIAQR